jgi:dihydrofolate reductase
MRNVINSTYVSLDGVIENPQDWSLDYFNDEALAYATDQLLASDALLMGRRTYEGQAAVWPSRSGDPFTDHINRMAKYVASTSLETASWNNTQIIRTELASEVARLKARPGKDILLYGFGPVSRLLLEHGLLDEIRLWLHPVFVGTAPEALLFRQCAKAALTLVATKTLRTGVVIMSYRPQAAHQRTSGSPLNTVRTPSLQSLLSAANSGSP